MDVLFVKNARILLHGAWIKGSLLAEHGVITAVGDVPEPCAASRGGVRVVDANDHFLAPGLLDLHTHGAAGVDVNAADAEGLDRVGRFFAAHGVTGWLCSILTDTEEQTLRCIYAAKEAMRFSGGARLLGIHLEGPFLSERYAGAMPKHLLRQGDLRLIRRYQDAAEGTIRSITVAPEVSGVLDAVRALSGEMVVALGHSDATYGEAMAAIDAGARCVTHTCNAMRLFHQHEPGLLGAALESDAYCEVIADGRHLHPGSVRMLLKAKGFDRVVPVTDSIMAAGLPDGEYRLGVNEITVTDGDAMRTGSNVRAGSTLTSDRALRNLREFTGEPLECLLPLMSQNPASLLGLNHLGRIAPGCEASFVLLDEQGEALSTYIRAQEAKA